MTTSCTVPQESALNLSNGDSAGSSHSPAGSDDDAFMSHPGGRSHPGEAPATHLGKSSHSIDAILGLRHGLAARPPFPPFTTASTPQQFRDLVTSSAAAAVTLGLLGGRGPAPPPPPAMSADLGEVARRMQNQAKMAIGEQNGVPF